MKKSNQYVLFPVFSEDLSFLNVVVSIQDASNILHSSHVIVSHEDMIKLVKRPFCLEELLIPSNSLDRHIKPSVNYVLSVRSNRFPAKDSLRNGSCLVSLEAFIWPSHYRIKVRTKFV